MESAMILEVLDNFFTDLKKKFFKFIWKLLKHFLFSVFMTHICANISNLAQDINLNEICETFYYSGYIAVQLFNWFSQKLSCESYNTSSHLISGRYCVKVVAISNNCVWVLMTVKVYGFVSISTVPGYFCIEHKGVNSTWEIKLCYEKSKSRSQCSYNCTALCVEKKFIKYLWILNIITYLKYLQTFF